MLAKRIEEFWFKFLVKFLILNFHSIDVKKSSDHPKLKAIEKIEDTESNQKWIFTAYKS